MAEFGAVLQLGNECLLPVTDPASPDGGIGPETQFAPDVAHRTHMPAQRLARHPVPCPAYLRQLPEIRRHPELGKYVVLEVAADPARLRRHMSGPHCLQWHYPHFHDRRKAFPADAGGLPTAYTGAMGYPSATDIARNLAGVRQAIASAARSAGRSPDDVTLIAVSKRQPPELIAAAAAAGQRDFGESTAQEAVAKIDRLGGLDAVWHFIGHLQSNKARFIPGRFAWLHSLDSLPLARRLSQLAADSAATLDVLIEVNIAHEPARHGVPDSALLPLIAQLLDAALPNIRLRGLMAIGPYPASEPQLRTAFAAVRALRDECRSRFGIPGFSELSMGMSTDFVPAILEGATMVRIGTAIFGARTQPAAPP